MADGGRQGRAPHRSLTQVLMPKVPSKIFPNAEAPSTGTGGALALLLLWNSLAGFASMRLPALYGDESRLALDHFGVFASVAPTADAGIWLSAIGLAALVLRRRGNALWHALATVFYGLQIV